jgi:capsular polysaccharide biosynthesis protein
MLVMHMQDWCSRQGAPFHQLARLGSLVIAHQPLTGAPSQATTYGRSEVFCARVPGATLFGEHGFLWTNDGCVIAHGLAHNNYNHAQLISDEFAKFAPQRGAPGPTIEEECVFFGGSTNIGHFLFQYLLKLHVIRQVPEARELPLAVYRDTPRRYLEFLDLAGYPEERRIYIDHERPVSFANVWIASPPCYRGHYEDRQAYVYPEALFGLREMILDRTKTANPARQRLYVSRDNARWRRIVNDAELQALLDCFGFTTVRMEEMSAAEQIELVSRAEIVVMPIGAGSPITLFAPHDCIVLELANRHIVGSFGAMMMAHILGSVYHRIIGEDVPSADLDGRPLVDMDYRIPMSAFAAAVEAAIDLSSRRRLAAEERRKQIQRMAPNVAAA